MNLARGPGVRREAKVAGIFELDCPRPMSSGADSLKSDASLDDFRYEVGRLIG